MSLTQLKGKALGRLELLDWLNKFLETDYTKIEHLADGVAYCQIFDAIYPGKVPLHRLDLSSRSRLNAERNLRMLERVFLQLGIRKEIPIPGLVSGKFQDNYNFLLWCYLHVQRNCPDAVKSYRAYERRRSIAENRSRRQELQNTLLAEGNVNLIPRVAPKSMPEVIVVGPTGNLQSSLEPPHESIMANAAALNIAESTEGSDLRPCRDIRKETEELWLRAACRARLSVEITSSLCRDATLTSDVAKSHQERLKTDLNELLVSLDASLKLRISTESSREAALQRMQAERDRALTSLERIEEAIGTPCSSTSEGTSTLSTAIEDILTALPCDLLKSLEEELS